MYPCQYKMLTDIQIREDDIANSEVYTIHCEATNQKLCQAVNAFFCKPIRVDIGSMVMKMCQNCPYRDDKNN